MDYFPTLIKIIVNAYFYLILIKFFLDMTGAISGANKFTRFVHRLTQPYLSYVRSMCRGIVRLYADLIALWILIWVERFVPTAIPYFLLPTAPEANVIRDVFFVFTAATVSTLLSALFFFGVLSLIYFLVLVGKAPLNNPLVSSITLIMEPLLTPLKKIRYVQKTNIAPLALGIVLFAGIFFIRLLFFGVVFL